MKKLGLRFDENLYGTYHPVGAPDERRNLMFRLRATSTDLPRTLLWDGRVELAGWVDAEGLAHHAPVTGTLIVQPLVRRRMRYELAFTAADGTPLSYVGTKTIRHLRPLSSWTTIAGAIFDAAGTQRFESDARFDLLELLPFLRSYQLLPART